MYEITNGGSSACGSSRSDGYYPDSRLPQGKRCKKSQAWFPIKLFFSQTFVTQKKSQATNSFPFASDPYLLQMTWNLVLDNVPEIQHANLLHFPGIIGFNLIQPKSNQFILLEIPCLTTARPQM